MKVTAEGSTLTAGLTQTRVEEANTHPSQAEKRTFLMDDGSIRGKNQQTNNVAFLFLFSLLLLLLLCPANEHQNIRCCQCDHEAPHIMFPNATPHNTNEKATWNISIKPTYFNTFSASARLLSSQDGWARYSIWQTDELKPKQYIFLSHLMNK